MKKITSHRTIPVLVGACIACFSIGAFADVRVGTSVGFTKTFTKTRVAPEHVCRYEDRPVVKSYTGASGGRYEQHTTERVRICQHTEVVAVQTSPYPAPRPRVRKSDVSFSIGFYDGGHGHYRSPYYGRQSHYRDRHHYRPQHHYGHRDSHRGHSGHRSHKKGGHKGRH